METVQQELGRRGDGPKTGRVRSGQVQSGQVWLGVGAFYFLTAGERIPFRPHVFYTLLEKRQKPEHFI
jgi:hypothetical protein